MKLQTNIFYHHRINVHLIETLHQNKAISVGYFTFVFVVLIYMYE